jgi:predicted metallopeptidase
MNGTEWAEAPDLEALAGKLIERYPVVGHIEPGSVLFLWERKSKPSKVLARTYDLRDYPIGFFTDKPFCIVFYERVCDYMSEAQRAILMLHELMHLPLMAQGRLRDHTVKDFRSVLGIDLDWAEPNRQVPNILGEM